LFIIYIYVYICGANRTRHIFIITGEREARAEEVVPVAEWSEIIMRSQQHAARRVRAGFGFDSVFAFTGWDTV
jgi:hypothetical protein